MNNVLSKNIKKHRELKGYSQEYMAHELKISQPSYAKIENDSTQITVDRLSNISKILDVDIIELLDLNKQTIYNQSFSDYSQNQNFQEIHNLHQENKEIFKELLKAKDEQIELLKEQLALLTKRK